MSLKAGGQALRAALEEAVAGRIAQADGPVSLDVSGGLDSATLAGLTAPARPLLVTAASCSPADSDLPWARQVAGRLEGCTHRMLGANQLPDIFAGLNQPQPALDFPATLAVGRARREQLAGVAAAHGSRLHLTGRGGDEVLLAPLAYLRPALATAPRVGWRHLRGHAALTGASVWRLACALAARPTYAQWLHAAAEGLCEPTGVAVARTGWEAPPRLAPWASPTAVRLVATAMRQAKRVPSHPDATTHATLARIRASAANAAACRQIIEQAGVWCAMPYFDRPVIEACLATRPWARTDPWQAKPLLAAGCVDLLPPGLVARRTKGDYTPDVHAGWRRHRRQATALLVEGRLVDEGLVDPSPLKAALGRVSTTGLPVGWLAHLLGAERWLRDLAPPFARPRRAREPAGDDSEPARGLRDPVGRRTDGLASRGVV